MAATITVILGGGFGGLAAANTLRRLLPPEHEVVVVDRSADFHVGAGKTWVALGERKYEHISRPRTSLLDPGVRFVQARVLALELAERRVATDQVTLRFDQLIIALGADPNLAAIPGLAEAAESFYTVEGAQRLRHALERFSGGEVVLVIPKVPIKCPPAPYEAAMLLQHAFERVASVGRPASPSVPSSPRRCPPLARKWGSTSGPSSRAAGLPISRKRRPCAWTAPHAASHSRTAARRGMTCSSLSRRTRRRKRSGTRSSPTRRAGFRSTR